MLSLNAVRLRVEDANGSDDPAVTDDPPPVTVDGHRNGRRPPTEPLRKPADLDGRPYAIIPSNDE